MTDFREDLEYWTDEIVTTQKIVDPLLLKMNEHGPSALTPEDLFHLRIYLNNMKAQIHWVDRTVNHYPTPSKKFWQFWKK